MDNLKGLQVTSYASKPLITLADAKVFLRIDGNSEDDLISLFIDSATREIENYLRRSLITQTLKLTLDSFDNYCRDEYDVFGPGIHQVPRSAVYASDFIYLARPPVQSITSLVTYDESNNSSVFDSDSYSLDAVNGRVYLNEGYTWPTSLRDKNAIEVTYVAGYGDDADEVPSPIRRATYALLNQIYQNRGVCKITQEIKNELSGYKLDDYLGFS